MNKWAMMYDRGNAYGGENRYDAMEDRGNEMRRRRDERGRYMEMEGRYDNYDRYDRYDNYDRRNEMRGSLIGFEREKDAGLIGPDNRYNEIKNGKIIPMQEKKRGMEQGGEKDTEQLDKRTAKKWVESMKGAPFAEEEAKKYAEEMGLDDEEIFPSFYAAMNAVYTDYKMVARMFHVDRPEFYAEMAKAFICDEDAVENKAKMYYENVVEHK